METPMTTEVTLREFHPRDKEKVAAFFDQMGGETRAFFNRNDGNRKTAMRFFDGEVPNAVYFLAEMNNEMAGYVYLWDVHTSVPWLGVAVSENMKGKHFGRTLVRHAVEYCASHGKGGILLTTHVANLRGQGLYERMGFECLGTHANGELLYLLRLAGTQKNSGVI